MRLISQKRLLQCSKFLHDFYWNMGAKGQSVAKQINWWKQNLIQAKLNLTLQKPCNLNCITMETALNGWLSCIYQTKRFCKHLFCTQQPFYREQHFNQGCLSRTYAQYKQRKLSGFSIFSTFKFYFRILWFHSYTKVITLISALWHFGANVILLK